MTAILSKGRWVNGAYAITQLFLGRIMIDENNAIVRLLLVVYIDLPFSQSYGKRDIHRSVFMRTILFVPNQNGGDPANHTTENMLFIACGIRIFIWYYDQWDLFRKPLGAYEVTNHYVNSDCIACRPI